MKISIVIAGLFIIFQGCHKASITAPACIRAKIDQFKMTTPCNDAKVDEYLFQNNSVYVFDEGACASDAGAEVLSSSCESLGVLGGFSGNGIIQGENFSENAVFQKTIWKK